MIRLVKPSTHFATHFVSSWLTTLKVEDTYQRLVKPNEGLLGVVVAISILEVVVLLLPKTSWLGPLEVIVAFALAVATSWLASRLFKRFFDFYLLNAVIRSGRKINSELLILLKWLFNLVIAVLVALLFAQTHRVNVVGLLASLGIGGLAVAFAAQKTLEQVLGGIVLYLDRPFVVGDYIGLPDGTFGQVEAIGLRSTRIRASGRGTLVIVPNSSLTQINIENFTGAKKIVSILCLTFHRVIVHEEQALIRQVIVESTVDIPGIDSRNTEVNFKESNSLGLEKNQAQITFFILGAGEVSTEIRRQLLDLANQSITQRLQEYGITFDVEEPTVYVDSPITI
ncbi:MAG: mechanosensitive ion channel domain-containing protein, partial [Kovacikia sp.]